MNERSVRMKLGRAQPDIFDDDYFVRSAILDQHGAAASGIAVGYVKKIFSSLSRSARDMSFAVRI